MISFLERHLPIELVEIIARNLHEMYVKDICEIIKYKIVFIITKDKMSWLVCEKQNYYNVLEVFNGNWKDI